MTAIQASRSARSLLLVLLAFALGVAAGGRLPSSQAENDPPFQPIREAFELIQSQYIDAVAIGQLVEGALTGMVDSLGDEFSYYISPEVYARDYRYSGEFTGIGVMVDTTEQGDIQVRTVVPGSPAEAVGVLVGDVFHVVDGESVAGLTQEDLSALVPGPRGTTVRVTFRRGAGLVTFDIVRDVFEVPNVDYALHGDIAYIVMQEFHNLSRKQLEAALASLDMPVRSGLIFDLRGNPGGTIESAIEIASLFIEAGEVILQQVDRDGQISLSHSAGESADINVPIALLVDSESASASELLAGALQDHQRATIIGEATFGKGTVQTIHALANGGALRLTARRYLTPLGRNIEENSIVPDILIMDDDSQDDKQLAAAIDYLESLRG
ncbi:MAG: S41 family peptidase [Chloroflexota bacterium]|nr:S41 family peptidase [Chloroflexota bacterium]MCY3583933.1 S41 family peptidase [Chloroflexota bacterium]MDE2651383.1 S41 family peptidase [Chloroflexota bacterium]MXX51397.1 S41 family peptidase [Chloroflexota bacterium]MXX82983.1 S41 family peptidase [Chloroflexota bacterium]